MKTLKVLLLDRLLRDEAHLGPTHCLANRLRIVGIVLLRLHVRLDELRRHQPDSVPETAEGPRPIVCTAAGFDPD